LERDKQCSILTTYNSSISSKRSKWNDNNMITETYLTTREWYLTVVFWDIKNFSSLCDILKTHSALLVPFLREFFEIANQIICQEGSILNEFLGDGLMAIFGMQSRDRNCADDAICAVQAAIELRKRFNCLETKWVNIWSQYV